MKKLTKLLLTEHGDYMIAAFIIGIGVATIVLAAVLSIVLDHYQIIPR